MATNLALQLVSGLSPAPTLQRYVRNGELVGAIVGSAVTGVVDATYTHVWNFNVTGFTGDNFVLIAGVSTPNALPFPMRDGIAYPGIPWSVVDATITASPVIPSPITGLCNVLVSAVFNGESVAGGSVHCHLEDKNNTVDGFLASRAVESGVTDSLGNCILTLIQFGKFTRGGIYRLKVYDADGKVLHDRRVTIPNTTTANAEDLLDA